MRTKRKPVLPGKKHLSLQLSLVLLIFGLWVVPIMVILLLSGYSTTRNTQQRVSDIITASVENTVAMAQNDLDALVNDALGISYVPTIRNAYKEYTTSGNKVPLLNDTRSFLGQSFYRSQMARSVYVVFPELTETDRVYTYNQDTTTYNEMMTFYSSRLLSEEVPALMETLGSGIGFHYEEGRLYLVRLLSLQEKNYAPYAMVVIEVNQERWFHGVENLPWLTRVTLWLDGTPMAVKGEEMQSPVPDGTDTVLHQTQDDELMMYASLPSSRYDLSYRVSADLQPLAQQLGLPRNTVLWAVLFSTALLALILWFMWRRINRPISTLSRFARLIEHGEFGAQIDAGRLGSREFVYLGNQMNAMSARLEDQFERLYREELALRDARIKALQSQINPHFLGNTLEIINWEARLAGNFKVSKMLEALSTMLEAALDRRRLPLIHLSQEMLYVNSYLYIIGERLGKRLEVEKDIDESLMDALVPRLILQPIVENAIEHGVSAKQWGHIIIRAYRESSEWMRLEVENNSPMSHKDEEKVHQLLEGEMPADGETSGNIGIHNVHQRLRILYGAKGGLTVKTTKKGSTVSLMCIGLSPKQQIEST